jgi:hypothetical protein
LKRHPGLTAKEIVKRVKEIIDTKAVNTVKLIYATLAALKKGNKIRKDQDGRYRLNGD